MTTLHLAEVAAAVAALDYDGVTCYGLNTMPQSVELRGDVPVFGPSASDPSFLTDWESRVITLQGNRQNTYTLNFTLFQAQAAKGRGLFETYPDMVESAARVVNRLQSVTKVDGCKHIAIAGMPQFGQVFDASGKQFHGATISLRVTEF